MLLLTEGGARLLGFRPRYPTSSGLPPAMTSLGYFYRSDPELGFRLRSDGRFYSRACEPPVWITTDRLGFRNGFGWSPDRDLPLVLFLGDSTTLCAEVADDETGPSEVARRLVPQHAIRVLNAGVGGYNTVQVKRMLERCLRMFPHRVKAAVYTFCDNDFAENVGEISYPPLQAPIMTRTASGQWVEKEIENPVVPWGSDYLKLKYQLVALHSRATPWWAPSLWLYPHSALASAMRQAFHRRDSLPGEGGAMLPGVSEEAARKLAAGEPLELLLREMREISAASGVALLVTRFTTAGPQDSDEGFIDDHYLADACRRAGVQFVSIKAAFTGERRSYMTRLPGHTGYDPHYSPQGTRAYAEALAPSIEAALRAAGL